MDVMDKYFVKTVAIRCSYLCQNASKMIALNFRCPCTYGKCWTVIGAVIIFHLVQPQLQTAVAVLIFIIVAYVMAHRIPTPWKRSVPLIASFRSATANLRPVATPLRRDLFGLPDVEEGTDGLADPRRGSLTPTTMSRLGAQENKLSWIGKPIRMKHSTYIRLDEEIGRGASKTVWLAQDLDNEKRVAWSMVHMAHQSKKENDRAISELALLMSHSPYRHQREGRKPVEGTIEAGEERLVRLLDMMPSDTHLHIITELIDGGSLRRWSLETQLALGRAPSGQELEDLSKVAIHISHGLAWLHQHNIIHRDVRPENILVKLFPGSDSSRIQSAVLADMGLFAFSPVNLSEKISIAGRDEYLAPEIVKQMVFDDIGAGLFDIKFSANYSSKVDVWMLGLSIAEIPTNQLPSINIHRCSEFAQYTDALEERIRGSLDKIGSEDLPLRSFLRHALVVDPAHRACSAFLWNMLHKSFFPESKVSRILSARLSSSRSSAGTNLALPL